MKRGHPGCDSALGARLGRHHIVKLLPRAGSRRSPVRAAVTLAAGLAVVLTPALVPLATASGTGPAAAPVAATSGADPECSPQRLQGLRTQADLFAAGCAQLAEDYGTMDDSSAENTEPGRVASRNMSLIAQRPRSATFANATHSDLAFKGDYVLRRQLRRLHGLRRPQPPQPPGASPRWSAPARRATCRSTRTCSS